MSERYTQFIQIHGKQIEDVLQSHGFVKLLENYTSPNTGLHYSNILEFLPAFFECGEELNLKGFKQYEADLGRSLYLPLEQGEYVDACDIPGSAICYYPRAFDDRLPEFLSQMIPDELFHFIAYSPFSWSDSAIINFKDGELMTNSGKKATAILSSINLNTQLKKNDKGSYLLSVPTGHSDVPFIKTLVTDENIHRYNYPHANTCDVILTKPQILAIYPNGQYKTFPAKEFEQNYYIAKAAYRDYMSAHHTITGIPTSNFRQKENENIGSGVYYVISLPVNTDFSSSGNIYLTSTPEACNPEEGTLTLYELGKKRSVYIANDEDQGDRWIRTDVTGFSIVEAATGEKIKIDPYREEAENYLLAEQEASEVETDPILESDEPEEYDEI